MVAVQFENLTREQFETMGYRETVQNIPGSYGRDGASLTKTQIATLVLIHDASTRGFGQIRDYRGGTLASGTYIPSESVPQTLDEKGFVRVQRRKQVSRRTGRTSSGFETKLEGGYVTAMAKDELDALAQQLGFDNRFDDEFTRFAREIMQNHPQARER